MYNDRPATKYVQPLFFAGVLLFAVGLPLSIFLMSVSGNFHHRWMALDGDLKGKIKDGI